MRISYIMFPKCFEIDQDERSYSVKVQYTTLSILLLLHEFGYMGFFPLENFRGL